MEATTQPKPNPRDKSKNLTKQIGARIAMYREQVGLSQTAVAKKAGLSPSHLCNMEKGDRSIDVEKLGAIARALNCKVVDFLPIAEGGQLDENIAELICHRFKCLVELALSQLVQLSDHLPQVRFGLVQVFHLLLHKSITL